MVSAPDVVIIAFNRPDLLEKTLGRILECDVGRVWVAGDGPRPGRAQDELRVAEVREVVRRFKDPRLVPDYADTNLGLRRNFERGIDRLIGEHRRGVVLEDDTLVHPSFFLFVAELLARYANDDRIGSIAGQGFVPAPAFASYSFSHIMPPWAWATWERSWKDYERALRSWPELKENGGLDSIVGAAAAREWGALFDHAETTDSYWIRWVLTHWVQHRLSVIPRVNLVSNLGVDDRGTHTTSSSRYAQLGDAELESMTFPLVHPHLPGVRNVEVERRICEAALPFSPLRRRLKELLLEGPIASWRSLRSARQPPPRQDR